jgi:hypothetical protein
MKSRKRQDAQQKPWRTYEEVAAYLLNRFAKEFGLKSVEKVKQKIQGQSGARWAIDAKGIREDDETIVIECRRHTRDGLTQEELGGLAFRVIDIRAAGGITVSPLGLQEGAEKVAAAKNIISVKLDANSTPKEFVIQFFDKLCLGITAEVTTSGRVSPSYFRTCAKCGKKFEVSGNRLLCTDCDP